ncbi:hypothetical protein [Persephonella sp. KM09-Lau-8]|uniref:hypothetical protein n=1 Tax=Persephonella sp. KM09-Lau-8 TaxID=1158345 RepID=UPI000497E770|nr:hypothetical protein [Persephonella sp. KM09-Lau-8]
MSLENVNWLFVLGIFSISVSIFVLAWYLYTEFFSYRFSRKGIPSYLKGIVDSEGRLILSSLASIWYENKRKTSLTSEDYKEVYSEGVRQGVDKALEQIAREFFEPKVFSDGDDKQDEVKNEKKDPVDALFENLPPKAIIEVIIPSVLKLDIPSIKGLSEEEKNIIYRNFLDRLFKEQNFKEIGSITSSVGERIYKEEVEKFVKGSIENAKEKEEVKDENKETIEKLLKKQDKKEPQDSFSLWNGNLPSEFVEYFVKRVDLPEELVRSLRFSEPDFVLLEARMDFLAIPEVKDLLRFMIDLHSRGKLHLFFSQKYDISKLFKDYLLYVTSCLSDRLFDSSDVDDSPVYAYFKKRASYYYSLKMCRPGAYESARKGKWGPVASKEVMFLPVVSGYLASVERPELEKEFVDLIISNLNVKVQDMFFRSFTFTDKKTGEIDTDDRYFDHLGFSYQDRIYLLPYAVDLWLDYYSLAMPYVLSSVVKVDFSFGRPSYVHPYTVFYRDGRSRTFKFAEVTNENNLNKVLINALMNKEVMIKDYQNIETVERVTLT